MQLCGDCNVAINDKKVVTAFENALKDKRAYILVCLYISLPILLGPNALSLIRDIGSQLGITGSPGVKVIMATAFGDCQNIFGTFNACCERYLLKPIEPGHLKKKFVN